MQSSTPTNRYTVRTHFGYYWMFVVMNIVVLAIAYLLFADLPPAARMKGFFVIQGLFVLVYGIAFWGMSIDTIKLDGQELTFRNRLNRAFGGGNRRARVALGDIKLVCLGTADYNDQALQAFGNAHPELASLLAQNLQQLAHYSPLDLPRASGKQADRKAPNRGGVIFWLMVVTSDGSLLGADVDPFPRPQLSELVSRLQAQSIEVQAQDRAVGKKS